MSANGKLTPVWFQNLRGFVQGVFPADEEWKAIFLERLDQILNTQDALQTENARLKAEVDRLDRCLAASDARTDENLTADVNNAFDSAKANARIVQLEDALREISKHPIKSHLVGWYSCQDRALAALAGTDDPEKTAT